MLIKMKKVLLALVLAVGLSGNAYAWTKLAETYDSKNQFVEHYYDKDSLEKDGNFLRIWTETIIKEKKDGNRISSFRFLHQINCKGRQARSLSYYSYDRNGNITKMDNTVDEWKHIPPDSFPELILKRFCS
jgi:uncharacterized protein YxeA